MLRCDFTYECTLWYLVKEKCAACCIIIRKFPTKRLNFIILYNSDEKYPKMIFDCDSHRVSGTSQNMIKGDKEIRRK